MTQQAMTPDQQFSMRGEIIIAEGGQTMAGKLILLIDKS